MASRQTCDEHQIAQETDALERGYGGRMCNGLAKHSMGKGECMYDVIRFPR
jgi:hypothetical protein